MPKTKKFFKSPKNEGSIYGSTEGEVISPLHEGKQRGGHKEGHQSSLPKHMDGRLADGGVIVKGHQGLRSAG
jgi:hypothetical protein